MDTVTWRYKDIWNYLGQQNDFALHMMFRSSRFNPGKLFELNTELRGKGYMSAYVHMHLFMYMN